MFLMLFLKFPTNTHFPFKTTKKRPKSFNKPLGRFFMNFQNCVVEFRKVSDFHIFTFFSAFYFFVFFVG